MGKNERQAYLKAIRSRYRRGPAFRQPSGSRFFSQVSEYLVDHRRIFYARNYLDETGTFAANTG